MERVVERIPDTHPEYRKDRERKLEQQQSHFWGAEQIIYYEKYRDELLTLDKRESDLQEQESALDEYEAGLTADAPPISLSLLGSKRKFISDQRERLIKSRESKLESCDALMRNIFHKLLTSMVEVHNAEPHSQKTKAAVQEIGDILFHADTLKEIASYFAEYSVDFDKIDLIDLKIFISRKIIPHAFLYKAMKRHQEFMKEREKEIEQMFEETKIQFLTAVEQGIADGWLPVDIQQVRDRLTLVKAHVIDLFFDPESNEEGNHHASGAIGILSHTLEDRERIQHIIFHELVHEIAGKIIQKITDTNKTEDQFLEQKGGFAFHQDISRFTWFNEAVTEWLALRLSKYFNKEKLPNDYKGSHYYPRERQELDRLFDRGLTEKEVLSAFFENIHDEQKGKNLFITLWKRINELEGDKEAFLRLENAFLGQSIASGLRKMGIYSGDNPLPKPPPGTQAYPIVLTVGKYRSSQKQIHLRSFLYTEGKRSEKSINEQKERIGKVLRKTEKDFPEYVSFTIGEPYPIPSSSEV